jgi:lipoprotein NlpI
MASTFTPANITNFTGSTVNAQGGDPAGQALYDLFAGRGTVEQVFRAAEAGENTGEQRRSRRFYAHLYTGLYDEMRGQSAKARALIEKATKKYPISHYMLDVAWVHLSVKK